MDYTKTVKARFLAKTRTFLFYTSLMLVSLILTTTKSQAQVITTNYLAITNILDGTKEVNQVITVLEMTDRYLDISGPVVSDTWYHRTKLKKVLFSRNRYGELGVISSLKKKKVFLLRVETCTKIYDFYAVQDSKEKR
jgi:hypothetical protein